VVVRRTGFGLGWLGRRLRRWLLRWRLWRR